MVALVALVANGCGGGAKTSDPQANPTQTKGLERQSPAQVQPGCRRDLKAAKSVHVTGTAINNGKPVRVDLRIQSNASSGTMELHGVKLEFITTGNTYLKADQQTWATLEVPAVAELAAGRPVGQDRPPAGRPA